jgi:hypothetical protein
VLEYAAISQICSSWKTDLVPSAQQQHIRPAKHAVHVSLFLSCWLESMCVFARARCKPDIMGLTHKQFEEVVEVHSQALVGMGQVRMVQVPLGRTAEVAGDNILHLGLEDLWCLHQKMQ